MAPLGYGWAITPAAPGAARLQFAEGLLAQVRAMTGTEQLQLSQVLGSSLEHSDSALG